MSATPAGRRSTVELLIEARIVEAAATVARIQARTGNARLPLAS